MATTFIETNEFQTPITQELVDSLSPWVKERFLDFIDNVPLINYMISPNRPRAKDLPRDDDGKIIVDIAHPHILEDVDYFRPAAKFFEENGCYTFLKPNPNPRSEYGKWITEEARRCREGYVRESDGEWVTGFMYWYLNYCRIKLTKVNPKTGVASQVPDFPLFWEGVYYRFHYIHQARIAHKHGIELARRGCGKSYSIAGMMSHNLVLGENEFSKNEVTTILAAYLKEYLSDKDGTLNKFVKMKDFVSRYTEFPRLLAVNRPSDMLWIAGTKDNNGTISGSNNSVMGVAVKDDEAKVRGKRGFIFFEEMGCHLVDTEVMMYDGTIKKVQDVILGDRLMGDDGTPRIVQEIHHGFDTMYQVTLTNGDTQVVNSNHQIPYIVRDWYRDTDTFTTATAPELLQKDLSRGYYIPKSDLKFQHKDVAIDPYLLGLWLGDGDKTWSSLATADIEIADYLTSTFPDIKIYNLAITDKCKGYYIPAKYGVVRNLRKMGLLRNKHIPDCYIYNDEETQLKLLAGLVDTDGDYLRNKHSEYFEIIQCREHLCILKAAKRIASSLGFRCSLRPKISGAKTKKPGETYYRLSISGELSRIPTRIKRKQAKPRELKYKQRRNNNWYGFKVSEWGYGEFYGFTVDGNHLFLLEDMTVTHNSFKNLLATYNNTRDSVKDGEEVFAEIYLVGTAGDKDSDFSGAKDILYDPDSYEIYSLPNVYDLNGKGRDKFGYFFPSYISRTGCMDKDGNSDVVKSLIAILNDRDNVRRSKPETLLSVIAQRPITPEEAILRVRKGYFPTDMINERLRQIDQNPRFYDSIYIGTLVEVGSKVEFKATDDIPIREWPIKKNDNRYSLHGALEIFRMPPEGDIPPNRYVLGIDPIENDEDANSESLFAMEMFDLFNDEIVAEYCGRMELNNDNCYLAWLLCRFYNAKCMPESNKKNVYAYFAKKHSIYMLADCPEYLKQKDIIKYSTTGSSSKGVQALPAVISFAQDMIKDWLMEESTQHYEGKNGQLQTESIPGVYKVWSRGLLKELLSYGPGANTDRVSALMQVMLYRHQFQILYGEHGENVSGGGTDDADDEFFNIGWDKYSRISDNTISV